MKLSSNSLGMLIFIALATAVFALMVLRPAVDGNAMNLGVPMSGEMAAVDTSTEAATPEVKMESAEEKESEAATENAPADSDKTETETATAETTSEESSTTEAAETETSSEETSTESTTTN